MKKKVLVVEDEVALNEAYQMILENAGYTVVVAHDGEDALEKTKAYEPDIILLDLRMPRLNGIGFLEQYELPKLHPKVKVIVFSNLDTQSEIDEAYKLGAERYILKAWASPRELLNIIEDTLKVH
jgi:DNA-binding response OmpR family regulator